MLLSGFHHCCWKTRAVDLPDPIIPSSRLPGFCRETEPSVHAADALPLPPPVPASKSSAGSLQVRTPIIRAQTHKQMEEQLY